MNGVYIRSLSPEELHKTVREFDEKTSDEEYLRSPARAVLHQAFQSESKEYVAGALVLEQERVKLLTDFAEATEFFFLDEPQMDTEGVAKWK